MRLFVGLDLPWEVRERLAALATGMAGARWQPIDNLHLTLRFVGEVQRFQAEELDASLASLRAKRFPVSITGVGTFARGGREVALWAGVQRSPALEHLAGKIETACQRAGLSPERRRFSPHVTLARLDNVVGDKLARFVQANNLLRLPEFPVDSFALFSSRRGSEESVYEVEMAYPLDS